MGILDFLTKPVRDQFIARHPSAMDALVFRHPDQSLPWGAKVTVRADEQALFFREGRLFSALGPGTHTLETRHLPFLGDLLVSPLTGDQHFITELFFVRTSEQALALGPMSVGMHRDLGSGHLVSILARARVNVRVADAARLIVGLGGLREDSGARVEEAIRDRMSSLLSACVGELASSASVVELVSNRFSEEMGQRAMQLAEESLLDTGVRLVRMMALQLSLDAESERTLRDFGAAQARLNIERQGADVATTPGFAAYHAAHGQRALLEGMGTGAAKHGAPAMLMPLAMGGVPGTSVPSFGTSAIPASPWGGITTRLSRPPEEARYELRTSRGIDGPFVERQVALRLRVAGFDAAQTYIRRVGETGWTPLEEHPVARTLIQQSKALPLRAGVGPNKTERFDQALELAAADGVLAAAELTLLARIAHESGLAADLDAARDYVLVRARALGLTLP